MWGNCNCHGNAGHYPLPPVRGTAGCGVAAATGLLGALGGILGEMLEGALLGVPIAPVTVTAAALSQQVQHGQQAARAEARRLQVQLRAQGRQQAHPAEQQWRQQ